jgi:hypothetical protein
MGREIRQRTLTVWSAVASGVGGVAFTLAGTYLGTHRNAALGLLAVGVICAVATPLITGLWDIRAEATSAKLEERENALATLVELTHQLCELDEPCDLRVTLMEVRRNFDPPRLMQIVRCGCSGRQNVGESWMTIQQGVAGFSLRKMDGKVESLVVNIDTGDFINQMVQFGFTHEQAKLFKERGSYLCAPIVNSMGEGIGVLCLDTKERDSFKPEHSGVAERLTPFFSRFLTASERSVGENA